MLSWLGWSGGRSGVSEVRWVVIAVRVVRVVMVVRGVGMVVVFWVVGAVWEVSWSVKQNTNSRKIRSHMEALILKKGCKMFIFRPAETD